MSLELCPKCKKMHYQTDKCAPPKPSTAFVDPNLTVRGTPRVRAPKGTGFDRKTYQREKARIRRAEKKKLEAKP